MKKSIAALLMCLISMSASAGGDDWGTKDTWILGGAMGLLSIDWAQTHDLASRNTTYYLTPACSDPATRNISPAGPCHPQRSQPYHEVNPLLPKNPSTGDVDKYFAIAMVGTAGLSYVLAPTYRRYFLGGVIVLESLVVLRNHQIGLRLSF